MAMVIKPKRKFTAGAPTTSDIVEGEIAINTADKKLYVRDNSNAIIEIGGVTGEAGMVRYQYVATNGQTTFTGSDANSETLAYSVGGLMVFLNGVYLQGYNNVDYTASNGTSVVLTNGAATNDVVDIVAVNNSSANLSGMNRYQYVATSNQTTFTGNDANGNNLSYVSGNLLVFLNGIYLQGYNNVDYTASNGTSVVLVNGAAANDVVDIVSIHTSQSPFGEEAVQFTVSANNSTNETVYPVFVDGATGAQGAETDTGLTYNPSTGVLTTASVTGNLTGNVTGNASGTAATVTGAAQTSITSLGTLTALTVDNVVIDGAVIGHTGDTDLITLSSGVVTVAGEVDATSLDVSGDADIDGTLEADAITVDGTALNEYIADTVGSMVSSNTETNITVTYQDADNTLDFSVSAASVDDATALAIALG